MSNPLEARQRQEQEERAREASAAADASRRRTRQAAMAQEDAIVAANLADPEYVQRVDASWFSGENAMNGQHEADLEQERIHALENAQREEAAAASTAARVRQHRDDANSGAWVRATQIPIPGGRRRRKTRKHSRKHTKKNRKMTRRRR